MLDWFQGIHFDSVWWFLALALAAPLAWLRRRRSIPFWVVPFAGVWAERERSVFSRAPALLAGAGLVLLVGALARPERLTEKHEVRTQGYDLMLAIDLSGSMLSEDYERGGKPISRVDAIKPLIKAFIAGRPNDRIGVIIFAGRAYTLSPLTTDHAWLTRQIDALQIGRIEEGTAIGDGLGLALMRLEKFGQVSGERHRGGFILLLTDGANNHGALAPKEAAQLARDTGVPVFPLGIGRAGQVSVPIFNSEGAKTGYRLEESDLDEGSLREIAGITGGRYFRADDIGTLSAAFAAIDATKKNEFHVESYYSKSELYTWLAGAAAVLLFAGAWLIPQRDGAPALEETVA